MVNLTISATVGYTLCERSMTSWVQQIKWEGKWERESEWETAYFLIIVSVFAEAVPCGFF
jgi:hypothetical protein